MHTFFQSPQKNCKALSHVFRMFYLPDWGWHLGLLSVVAGILFCYTILPARLERLSQLAFDGVPLATLVTEGGRVGCIICGIIVFSLLKRTLLHYVMRVRVLNRAQPLLLKQVLALPLDYFATRSPGDLLSVMTSPVCNKPSPWNPKKRRNRAAYGQTRPAPPPERIGLVTSSG